MQNLHKPPLPPPFPGSETNINSSSGESPPRSDDLDKNGAAIVVVEKFYSPLTSPLPITPPKDATTPDNYSSAPHQIIHFNRNEDAPPQSAVVLSGADSQGERKAKSGVRFGRGGSVIEKVNLGVRVLEIVFCLISFSVMASDKTQGWSGDSFDCHKEYRFCLSVNVLGFLFAAFQAYDAGNHLATGNHVISSHLLYQFDFIMDQILAYLLISASSAAASKVDNWQSHWGKDEFTEKASASVSMAFLAFLGFAMTSLISGYNLCNHDSS